MQWFPEDNWTGSRELSFIFLHMNLTASSRSVLADFIKIWFCWWQLVCVEDGMKTLRNDCFMLYSKTRMHFQSVITLINIISQSLFLIRQFRNRKTSLSKLCDKNTNYRVMIWNRWSVRHVILSCLNRPVYEEIFEWVMNKVKTITKNKNKATTLDVGDSSMSRGLQRNWPAFV